MTVMPSETAAWRAWIAIGAAPGDGAGVEGLGLGEEAGGVGDDEPEAQAAANSNDGRATVRIRAIR
jgi:hypothetical protein